MKRKAINAEDLKCGAYALLSAQDGKLVYGIIYDIDKLTVMNAHYENGEPCSLLSGSYFVLKLNKKERRAYFDMMRGEKIAASRPHCKGKVIIPAGTVLVSRDGRYGSILSCDIGENAQQFSSLNPVDFVEEKRLYGDMHFDYIFSPCDMKLEKKYWEIVRNNINKRQE